MGGVGIRSEPASFLAGGGDMGARIRAFDWSATPLGPPPAWPQSLKTAIRIVLTSRYAMFVWWGRDLINIYNDAYAPMLGARHPSALGRSAPEIWTEIWDEIGPRVDAVLTRGEATFDEDLLLLLDRHGYREEAYFTFSYSPLLGDDGGIGGLFAVVTEGTQKVIGERRLKLLNDLAAGAGGAQSVSAVCDSLSASFARHGRAFPFVLLYLFEPGETRLRLAIRSGLDADHPACAPIVDLERDPRPWRIGEALSRGAPVLIEDLSAFGTFPAGGWDRPPQQAVTVPIAWRGQSTAAGFMVAGLNPYLPFDDRSRDFVALAASQLATGIANARAYEEERRRAEALAAAERAKQIAAMTVRAEDTERRFRLLVDAVTDYAIFMLDPHGRVVNWNPGAQRIKGYAAAEIVGQHFSRFYTAQDVASGLPEKMLRTGMEAGRVEAEGWRVRKDGSRFWANVTISAIRDPSGEFLGFAKVTRDLTERRAAEERLRHAQKMEAIGQLTGGVAHDFNNLLAVISGNLEALQRRLTRSGDADLQRYISAGLRGTELAAGLTHRLLAFARRQPLEPSPMSIGTVIAGMSDMFRRTLGETIRVETVLGAGLWSAFVDPNELGSSLLNLAVNARDAMPDGGKLTIEAANVHIDEPYAMEAEVAAGEYVGLFVSDTGTGMSPETLAQAFEPFFTTKEVGRGTGLGLSQVYGFIRQSGGHVKIYSELGSGTTIKLYLPRYVSPADAREAPEGPPAVPQGQGEAVLVVDDDTDVRRMAVEMLGELGYRTVEAADAAAALRLLAAHRDVTILFTDVGLPGGMNGRQLADEARRRRTGLKVLYASGYPRDTIVHHGRLDPGVALLMKPFTFGDLAAKLRTVLDGAAR